MDCRYCRAWNAEDEPRCQRCGRRLILSAGPVSGHLPRRSRAATAVRLEPVEQPGSEAAAQANSVPAAGPAPATKPRVAINYQPSLFSSRELPRVVPFESISASPLEPVVREKVAPAAPRPRVKKTPPGQQHLDFTSVAPRNLTLGADPAIYCDAPVAVPMHRALAAAIDGIMIAFGLGLFVLTVYFGAGPISLNKQTVPMLAGAIVVFAVLYKLLWCLSGGDSPGMTWSRLRLTDFDGRAPERNQRMARAAAGILSFAAAGFGLFWALVDEEGLTWHDHISKTFPTPFDLQQDRG